MSSETSFGVNSQGTEVGSNPGKICSLSPAAQAHLDEAKAQTGFASYSAYLKCYQPGYPGLRRLHPHFQRGSALPKVVSRWQGSVISLTRASGLPLQEYVCTDTQGAGIVEALCDPPDDTRLQIVLWNVEDYSDLPPCDELIDFLGLVLKLDPRILEAVLASTEQAQVAGWLDEDRYHPTHATIGGVVATVCDSPHQSGTIPVVLVVGRLQSYPTVHSYADKSVAFALFARRWMTTRGLDRIRPSPPFTSAQFLAAVELDWPIYRNPYRILLNETLQKDPKLRGHPFSLLFVCFVPLLRMRLYELRCSCSYYRCFLRRVSWNKRDHEGDDLYDSYVKLRHLIDLSKNDWRSFVKFMKHRKLYRWSKEQLYRELDAEMKEVLAEADGLESQIRDDIQLEAGKLGLEESRRSIEMSNKQIEEAKRVTILAFVFFPLNLATSIFGMNLQQLNGNGRSLQAFIGTSFAAFIITGATWFFIDQLNSYRYWHTKQEGKEQAVKSKISVGERSAMVVWLLHHRKLFWMWKSGAWWRIPFHNDAKMIQDPEFGDIVAVTDYVSKYCPRANRSRVLRTTGPLTDLFDGRCIRTKGS